MQATWWLLLILYCAIIYVLSDQPVLPTPQLFSGQDKLFHAVAYAGLAWLFWQAARGRINAKLLLPTTLLFCGLYGLSDEWHQSFVPGRHADIYDWLADVGGAFLLTIIRWKREFIAS